MAFADHIPAEASLPTRSGDFRIHVFRNGDTEVVALSRGTLRGGEPALARLHSECLTGDALGSLRCDCGEQLERALGMISSAGRGVLLYLRHEGRGIGLFNKIKAYALQDRGLDTVDANVALGLPVDARDYSAAAHVLRELGVTRVRLITNNPAKIDALTRHGIGIVERVPIQLPANPVNSRYLKVKAERMGHLLDELPTPPHRPLVTVHYAQTIDGRIAARTGDARYVSGDQSLRLAHELRATHDAILVGLGTVRTDDPRLTVRLVEGRNPIRVIVDSRLRIPRGANVLADRAAPTIVVTTDAADPAAVREIEARGAKVLRVRASADGTVDLREALRRLRGEGIASVLVEGGRGIITSALRDGVVDRLTVCIAPKVIGEGISAVGDLRVDYLRQAMTFRHARFIQCGSDVVFYGEPARDARDEPAAHEDAAD